MNFLDRDDIQRRVERDLGGDFVARYVERIRAEITNMTWIVENNGFQVMADLYSQFHDNWFQFQDVMTRHRPFWFQFSLRKQVDAQIQSVADTRRIEHAVFRAISQALEGTDFTER